MALGSGKAVQPMPIALDFPQREGEAHVKPAYLHDSDIFVVKVATGFYDQPAGQPTGSGAVLVFSAIDGSALGLLADNGYLTDLRTGAAGALAADLLAPADVGTVAVIGTGSQARYQLEALSEVRSWQAAVVWGRDREGAERYAVDMAPYTVRVADTAEAAVREADVVVTTTRSGAPLLEADWLKPAATVIAVGSDSPQKQELDPQILGRAGKVVADDWSQCLRMGEIHHAIKSGDLELSRIHAELGKIVTGERSGREGDELIVCDLTGVGALDAAIAEVAWGLLG